MIVKVDKTAFITALNKSYKSTEKQRAAGRYYKRISDAKIGFVKILGIPDNILAYMGIQKSTLCEIHESFTHAVKMLSHSFNICNDCSQKLRGRKIRKDNNNNSKILGIRCDICGKKSTLNLKVAYIRSKYTLEQAKNIMQSHHPDVFI
jgi:NAD-dependent SIR2 family protein deacetylase